MNRQKKKIALIVAFTSVLLLLVITTRAHNPDLTYVVPSPGKPPAFPIAIDGFDSIGEWPGVVPFNIGAVSDPLRGEVKAVHKVDGIYLQVKIIDSTSDNLDALVVVFDINHNGGGAVDADDFAIQVLRNPGLTAAKRWGPASADPSTNAWADIPNTDAMITSTATDWTVEIHLHNGAPSNLDLSANMGKLGVYFQIFDNDVFGSPSAVYTQWPIATASDLPDSLDTLFFNFTPNPSFPNMWGDYLFDPATTFPNLTAMFVRRGDAGPANYGIISTTATNRFDVGINNPGGTVVPSANPVRINLYLAARGIGEPWHRLDDITTINSDCAAASSTWGVIPKNQVCTMPSGPALGDISTVPIANVNTLDYTINKGVTRIPPLATAVPGATNNPYQVLTWNLSGQGQDVYFTGDRAHECMLAEVIFGNDSNHADNTVQANMDFESMAGGGGGGGGGAGGGAGFNWGMGHAGFAKYDPAVGKDMFLQVSRKNMDQQAGWDFSLEGVKALAGGNLFVSHLTGKESQQARLILKAPPAETLGHTLKENLVVPPKAGGFQVNAQIPSGEPPVYVKVNGGSTLLIANYSFNPGEQQNVDLDGRGKLPLNGPSGLPDSFLQSLISSLGQKFRVLLAPNAPLGALVGSWDNFKTAFLIADGVQVKVPVDAKFLALGINDGLGFYPDNTGTGFRVKIVERAADGASAGTPTILKASFASQVAQQPPREVVPIQEVMPTLCINGYEDIGQKRTTNGTAHELFRYVGNVCWGIINVYPPNRSEKPDQGDVFDGPNVVPPKPKGCGSGRKGSFAFASFITLLGIFAIRRRTSGKAKTT